MGNAVSNHSNWRGLCRVGVALLLGTAWLAVMPSRLHSEIAPLKNGMQFEGRVGKISSLGEDPLAPQGTAGEVKIKQIVLIDNDLSRTFFFSGQTQSVVPKQFALERIKIEQRIAGGKRRIAAVGPIIGATKWDEWGRRIFTMNTPQGPLHIVQGITELTPINTKVEG